MADSVERIVFEWVAPNSEYAMSDGRGYWAFSLFIGENRDFVGSADDLATAMDMAQEAVRRCERRQNQTGGQSWLIAKCARSLKN